MKKYLTVCITESVFEKGSYRQSESHLVKLQCTEQLCPSALMNYDSRRPKPHCYTHTHFTFLFLTLSLSFFFLSGTESCASPRKVIIKYAAAPLLF